MNKLTWPIILRKELKDAFRDRRALMALLLFPLMGPAMIYFMLNMVLDLGESTFDITLPVVGAENSTDLIDYLEQRDIKIEELHWDGEVTFDSALSQHLQTLIDSRVHDFVLIIPDQFNDYISESKTVNVEIHFDSSRSASQGQIGRVSQIIQAWGRETSVLRLMSRGVDPQIITPVQVQNIDVSSIQSRAQSILSMIPLFVIMAAFVSGMGVAVDITAGERERKTLEPLLVNPISRTSIVVGKWLTAVLFSTMGLVLVLILNLFVLSKVPLEQIGIAFILGPYEIAGILVTTIPLAFFGTSIQLFVGIFAKSFKDAQAYLSLITLLPMAPYFYNILNSEGRELWMSAVPMLGQSMLLTDVVSGRTPSMVDFVLAGVMVLCFSAVFLMLAIHVFKRERIIFS